MKKYFILLCLILFFNCASAQLTINAPLYLSTGADITVVNMDVSSSVNVAGAGSIRLKNSVATNLNFNNNEIPSMIIDCNNAIVPINLISNVVLNNNLNFINGLISLNSSNLIFNINATNSNASANSYIVTSGTGKVVKNVNSNLLSYVLPVGTINDYEPVNVFCTGAYALGANVSTKVVDAIHPSKPQSNTDFLNIYWAITRTGISGSVNVVGNYLDVANVIGIESKLNGVTYYNNQWQSIGAMNNVSTNTNGASIVDSAMDLYGMNNFVQLKAKAFLQGAYNISTAKMNDNLRIPINLIPLSDPYRGAPYNTFFTHINNPSVEVALPSVFTNQLIADNNIVDWVFVELRNNAIGVAGSNKVKTRSALIQKDGDIVDVDGTSPLFFKDVASGQYSIAIRHRNHLGLCTDPISNLQNLYMKTPLAITDFTTFTDAQLFGKADSNYKLQGVKNLLYAGNANSNTKVSFSGLNNDKDKIFSRLTNQPNNLTVNNVYDASDINMNRFVRFVNLNNDKDFLFGILGGSASSFKNQAIP